VKIRHTKREQELRVLEYMRREDGAVHSGDVSHALVIADGHVSAIMARLVESGEIVRVRRGVYERAMGVALAPAVLPWTGGDE